MFDELKNNLFMLKGAYKKLKSYYYYDKSLLFIKKKIALFESTKESFNDTMYKIAYSLKNNDVSYFDGLIQNIKFVVLPKKMDSKPQSDNVIRSNVDHNKNISKLNFYIDAPIELLILDTLWMLFVGKIQVENRCRSSHSYASLFKKSLFNNEKDLFLGIDFESNRCFEPYFKNYIAWRDNAFSVIEKEQNNTDLVLMTLDLKSFYYSVDFDFKNLASLLNNDNRLQQIDNLSRIIRNVYYKYTSLIRKYKKGISKRDACVFPIGLLSPMVLREAYLKSFDDKIMSNLNPNYYARYVDDILLVLSTSELKNVSKSDLIQYFLVNKNIVSSSGKNDFKLVLHPTIKLQSQKIECFIFKQGIPNILLNIYKEQIQKNSSEANLLPDIDSLNTSSFIGNAYTLLSNSGSIKIRDIKFLQSDNYNATLFINNLKRVLKNTVIKLQSINTHLDQIMEFYSDSQSIEFSNNWRSIFELFALCKDKDRANKFYNNIKKYMNNLNFDLLDDDEIYSRYSKTILKKVKENLTTSLDIAISLAISVDYSIGKKLKHRKDAKIFRESNLLNHQLISVPLINYIPNISTNIESFIDINIVLKAIENSNLRLDKFKIEFTPRFIHIEELYFSLFLFCLSPKGEKYKKTFSNLFERYCTINKLKFSLDSSMIIDNETSCNIGFPSLIKVKINDK